jgi:predicted HTH domain antitoxin
VTITVQVPDALLEDLTTSPQELSREIRVAAAIHLYGRGLVSQGKGAEIAALNRWEFIQALGRAGVAACQVSSEELQEEVERAVEAHSQHIASDTPDQNRTD